MTNHDVKTDARSHDLDEQGRPIIPSEESLKTLPADGGALWNRLVFEKSPYLLQHAANSVDWYPWGEEAFKRAEKEDKPVFLSVGYTTCHWCHVMERESFEDEEVAQLMNDAFVCIKVDREERPDVDNVYMTVTQAITGHGGWPMTVVMTPDKRPFFAGTYLPKNGAQGRPGMMDFIPSIKTYWVEQRDRLLESAEQITNAVKNISGGSPGEELTEKVLDAAVEQLASRFDPREGGFGGTPKFPIPHNLSFLLRHGKRTGNENAIFMAEETLVKMRRGGVCDHVGFGFHRYSTDQHWLLPHFEKMLYDQALMALAYTDAYHATGKSEYATWTREILTYVLRDMTSEEGGFYSAEDADSEGEEGKFYVWDPAEVVKILGKAEGDLFNRVYNIEEGGNFFDEATRAPSGLNIPHLRKDLSEIAIDLGSDESDLRERLSASRQKLFDVRENRIHPQKDDKILTDWNGLMIAAFARAGMVLSEPTFVAAAKKASDFVLTTLRGDDGRLKKRYRLGDAGLPAHLEDHAFLAWGLLELYEATFDARYLSEASGITEIMLAHFLDESEGGFFLTADDGEDLLVRSKAVFDNAMPSGNSVAALNLVRLARITGNPKLEEEARGVLRGFAKSVEEFPSAHTQLLAAVEFLVADSAEVVVVGKPDAQDTRDMLSALRRDFRPNKVVLFRDATESESPLDQLAPFSANHVMVDGKATAYVCRRGACKQPVTDIDSMMDALSS